MGWHAFSWASGDGQQAWTDGRTCLQEENYMYPSNPMNAIHFTMKVWTVVWLVKVGVPSWIVHEILREIHSDLQ